MKPTIALFLHHPVCAVDCTNGTIKALQSHYNFKIFTKHELEDNFFDDVDMVSFPGGYGDSDSFDYLLKTNTGAVKRFIKNGGKYLGICMGAYWAGKHYFNLLKDAEVLQYIKQPNTDTRRPHAKSINVTWKGMPDRMYFYDGCAFTGTNFKTISTYANGDAMAIIQENLGLIGCHLESEDSWYDQYSWMKQHKQGTRHHELLLDFVSDLRNS